MLLVRADESLAWSASSQKLFYTQLHSSLTPPIPLNLWRVLSLAIILVITGLLILFYVVRSIWHRYNERRAEEDVNLLPRCDTVSSIVYPEESLVEYGTCNP
ncbi:hypothetical protein DdX_11955 [Ditylenchus destructor]|uniref:Uncharacterized protein n=1 Tax=Ditylenchus destructor TaxID=166010 RepID=A0AAD4QXS3_9BILA|nr:hypothetical protein DdX_11955 [Ditylenchus destructor]